MVSIALVHRVTLERHAKSLITVSPIPARIMDRVRLMRPGLRTTHASVRLALPDLTVTKLISVPPTHVSTDHVQFPTIPLTVAVKLDGMETSVKWKTSVVKLRVQTTETAQTITKRILAHVQMAGWVTTAPKLTLAIPRTVSMERRVFLMPAIFTAGVLRDTRVLTAQKTLMSVQGKIIVQRFCLVRIHRDLIHANRVIRGHLLVLYYFFYYAAT